MYIHDKIFWAAISRIQITVVIERIVWHINGKVIATTSYRNRSESFLKSAYHGVGNFCNLLAIIKRLNLFDFKVICLMLVCKGFIVRGFHWQHVVRYHVKMDKLLQKEAKVTKVPDDTYGEREREREREVWRTYIWMLGCKDLTESCDVLLGLCKVFIKWAIKGFCGIRTRDFEITSYYSLPLNQRNHQAMYNRTRVDQWRFNFPLN